jgi:glycine hydroxymethyltransferase
MSPTSADFDPPLCAVDPEIADLIAQENRREAVKLRLIPSENYASRAVLEATGSVLTNKYSEGYATKRYYEGQQVIDQVELLACRRLRELFGAEHVNVQPYSGSPANLAVYLAFCQPHDPIMGLGLPAGGHLTHGWNVSITGKFFRSYAYGVRRDDQRIDFDQVRTLAREHEPKIIWCGTTAYPRLLDFPKFKQIADEVGAVLCADIAHICGLVAAGVHPSPMGIADVVTSTTHKTFRGPRGGMIFCRSTPRRSTGRCSLACKAVPTITSLRASQWRPMRRVARNSSATPSKWWPTPRRWPKRSCRRASTWSPGARTTT